MIVDKLMDCTLTPEEFALLPYLDRRVFEETAKARFSKIDEESYSDKRMWIHSHLRDGVNEVIKKKRESFQSRQNIKLIELGSSLGALGTIYALDALYREDLANKVEVTLLDFCSETLERTKRLDFPIEEVYKEGSLSVPLKVVKDKLAKSNCLERNFLDIDREDQKYDLTLAPFIHHHLNIYDKATACGALEKITFSNGGIVVGDLSFTYHQFIGWLEEHRNEVNSHGEKVPYAVESFVSMQEHCNYFDYFSVVFQRKHLFHYVFALVGGEDHV